MKRIVLSSLLMFMLASFNAAFASEKIEVSCSEQDAKIFVDGVLVGNGQAKIVVPKNSCVNIKVSKVGFLSMEKNYCNKKGFAEPPEKDYIKLEVDEAYVASVQTDIANVDIGVKPKTEGPDAWKNLNQIVVSYFDVIELSDKETSYLRTAWAVQSFKSGVVRTRFIVKGAQDGYKVKLVSEISNTPGVSVKNDESFKEWDRVLRKYEGLIQEIQSRIK
jgi:hypothetical protein